MTRVLAKARRVVHVCFMVRLKDYKENPEELSDQCVANQFGYVDDLKKRRAGKQGGRKR